MKNIFTGIMLNLMTYGALCQAGNPVTAVKSMPGNWTSYYQQAFAQPLDSNEDYRNVREGYVLQAGRLNLAMNGRLFPQRSPVTLKNGSIVMTDGLIKMTNGSTPLLREMDFIDPDGNIKPLRKQ